MQNSCFWDLSPLHAFLFVCFVRLKQTEIIMSFVSVVFDDVAAFPEK